MKAREAVFYFVVMLICSVYAYAACTEMSVGNLSSPGPGFMPLFLGAASFFIAFFLFLQSLKSALAVRGKGKYFFADAFSLDGESREKAGKVILFVAALIIYILLFNTFNYYVLSFFLIVVLAKIFRLSGWIKPVVLGA
jgi:hypothetical protein